MASLLSLDRVFHHSYSAILCRRINILRRSDPLLPYSFSIEPGESQLAQTIEYVGANHFLFASDIPHWDCEFPGNLQHIRNHSALSENVKEKILSKNAKRLFNL